MADTLNPVRLIPWKSTGGMDLTIGPGPTATRFAYPSEIVPLRAERVPSTTTNGVPYNREWRRPEAFTATLVLGGLRGEYHVEMVQVGEDPWGNEPDEKGGPHYIMEWKAVRALLGAGHRFDPLVCHVMPKWSHTFFEDFVILEPVVSKNDDVDLNTFLGQARMLLHNPDTKAIIRAYLVAHLERHKGMETP